MRTEPTVKRAFAFFDGQNLFYAAKEAFGYPFPNYDPRLLTERVCAAQGWQIAGIHFYTGIPSATDKPFWNSFWTAKMEGFKPSPARCATETRPSRWPTAASPSLSWGRRKAWTCASPWTSCVSP